MTERRSEWYTVEVQRPDGAGWVTVHTHPHGWGAGPEVVAWTTLCHHWPVSVYDEDPGKLVRRRDILKEAAGWRMVLTPASHNHTGPREPVVLTLAEVVLCGIRAEVEERRAARAEVAEAKAKLAAARSAVRSAQARERVAGYHLDEYRREAALLGVPTADVTRAARMPRQPKGPS